MSSIEDALASGTGGISGDGGTIAATGARGIAIYQLAHARSALKLEINGGGMIVSRAVNAQTIIPWLVRQEITRVQAPFTRKRKVRAWNDLNDWMVAHGFEPMTLERPARRQYPVAGESAETASDAS